MFFGIQFFSPLQSPGLISHHHAWSVGVATHYPHGIHRIAGVFFFCFFPAFSDDKMVS